MARRFFLHLYMMRVALLILFLLGIVLPMAFRSPMFHGLADLAPNQILLVSMAAFLSVSAAITCAFLVLLYGSDRADGKRLPVVAAVAPIALPERLPLSGWVVGGLYAVGGLAYLRLLYAIWQTMKTGHVNPENLWSLFWYRAIAGGLVAAFTISAVFLSELWLSDPRQAPQIEVFALPMVYLFRESPWLREFLDSLSKARPLRGLRESKWVSSLRRFELFFVRILGPGYGQFDAQGRAVALNPGHLFAGMLVAICIAVYLMAGAGGHQRLYTDALFGRPRPYDAVLLQVILLLLLGCWLLSGVSFYFDRFRVPVLLPLVALLIVTSRFGTSDHVFHTFARATPEVALPNAATRFAEASDHIIAIAAAGGGIQAAAWTSQILCGLREDLGRPFERNVLVISGVSGGSLGILFYLRCVESPAGSADAGQAATCSSLEAIAWGPAHPDLLAGSTDAWQPATCSSLEAIAWGLAHPDLRHAVLPLNLWWPGDDRGWALERAIRKNAHFASADRLLTSRNAVENWPVLIFNSTEARTGDPFVFSNSDFPAEHDSKSEPHKLHNFHQIYSDRDVRLDTAVRMSAAFPYVSPAARADFPSNAEHLVDGGYFENSGMFSLAEWLKEATLDTSAGEKNPHRSHAPKKILVIQIDAFPDTVGTKPADKPRSWAYQLIAPILAILHVRSEGTLVRDATERSDLIELLVRRGYDASNVTARYVPSVGSKQSQPGVVCPQDPPLTWHMTQVEKLCIHKNWTDIESDLVSQVKQFLNSPIAAPEPNAPRNLERKQLKEGLFLHEMVKQ